MKIILISEARDLGLKMYFTGKPCINGHTTERYVNNATCMKCLREAQTRAYRKNPSKDIARVLRWQKENLEKHRAKGCKWWNDNIEKARAGARKSYRKMCLTDAYRSKSNAKQARRKAWKLAQCPSWVDQGRLEEI